MTKKKIEKIQKPISIWTLDTETRGLFGRVFRIGLYNGHDYFPFDNMGECYQLLKEHSKHTEPHIYIHNLDFDLSKIAGTILKDLDLKRCIFIEQNVAVFSTKDIILHDSLKLLPSSLDKICKDFGLGEAGKIDLTDHIKANGYKDKGDYFERVDPHEPYLNHYLKFDCTSLHTVIMQLIDISGLTIDEFVKCPTTASLAMKVFKETYPDDYDDVCSSNFKGEYGRFIEQVLRQGYYGGRTEVFQPLLEKGFHYDVNSLYPYVMKVNEFPIGWYDVYQDEQAWETYDLWKETGKGGGFASIKIHVPETLNIPPLPHRVLPKKGKKKTGLEGKLIFPTGNLRGTWAFPEIAMAEKYGCIIEEVEQVIYFKRTYPVFKEFVEQFQELKQTSKGAKRTFSKLVQNSLYGKFGMNRDRRTLLPIDELENVLEKGEDHFIFYLDHIQDEIIQVTREVHAKYIQPHIAGYVTAYARILLYEGLMNESNGNKAYCDTDSIACQNEFDPELIDENEYGKWKLENVLDYGIFLQPKLYMEKPDMELIEKEYPDIFKDMTKGIIKKYGDSFREHFDDLLTTKAKGVPGEIRKKFNEETYQLILSKINSGEERINFFGTDDSLFDSEYFTRKKFVTLLKNGEDFDTKLKIRKGMNLRAKQKRIIDYINNSSKPHNVNDYGSKWEQQQLKEVQQEMELELNKVNPLFDKIKQVGFIKTIYKGEQYYHEYSLLTPTIKRKYFRKTGIPLDVWSMETDEDIKELMNGGLN